MYILGCILMKKRWIIKLETSFNFKPFLFSILSIEKKVAIIIVIETELQSHPFIIKDGIQYNGYIIDVLDAMRNISDFDYYLYDTQELGTIDRKHGNASGLLGEVRTNVSTE